MEKIFDNFYLNGNCENGSRDCNNKWRSKGAKVFKKNKKLKNMAKSSRRKNRKGA